MTSTRRIALFWILLSTGISILWGSYIGQTGNGWVDFRAVYYGTRCLLENHNPYNVKELETAYRADGGERPSETVQAHQAVVLYVNVPTTFLVIAPFALLPWGPAHILWMIATSGFFILAACMMWDIGAKYSPSVSLFLICLLLIDCESIFVAGNTAGIVVSLCIVAAWCFLENRFVALGILSMAIALAVKPHDSGLVWLFFLLSRAPLRKRALQSLLVTAVLGIAAFLWLSHVAPHWIEDWQSNLATISAPGGINEPGPNSLTGHSSSMVIDLQAAISIIRDDPRVYNPLSYLVCGTLFLLWAVRTLQPRFTRPGALLALAAVTALTMLVTYHRPWDAKLLLLTVPACAMLWAEGGWTGRTAMILTTAGLVLTGDIPLVILVVLWRKLHVSTMGFAGQALTLLMLRPASLILLAMAIFYLWIYLRRANLETETSPNGVVTSAGAH
ncbi:MAG: glycosyltransferase family 87 protein [Terracidiphilus sp.]